MMRHTTRRLAALACLALASALPAAQATDLTVVSSGGFAEAYKRLAARYEAASGNKLTILWGPSMGNTANTIPKRLERGEPIDVVIMVGEALDQLMKTGRLVPASKVVLADSMIACAVPKGDPKPDISTVENLTKAFLNARSVAYSDSASGEYIKRTLMKRLGIEAAMEGKAAQIPATPVGEIIAERKAAFGCQQLAELKPVHDIDIVGLMPREVNLVTEYSAAAVTASTKSAAAADFVRFLASRESAAVLEDTGLLPRTAR